MNAFEWSVGTRLVLRLQVPVTYQGGGQARAGDLAGEVELEVAEASGVGASFRLIRLGVYGRGHEAVGYVSVGGLAGTAVLAADVLTLTYTAGVTYNALEIDQYRLVPGIDHFGARREIFAGQLVAQFVDLPALRFRLVQFSLQVEQQFLGLIESIGQREVSLGRADHYAVDAPLACPPELRRRERRLRVRAVFLRDHPHDPGTGVRWPQQLNAARRIWRKCGIRLSQAKPPRTLMVSSTLKEGENPLDVALSHFDQPGIILVFFIAGEGTGGGFTFADGAAHARCVISDKAVGNVNVLAHEIGHVFDGDHPGHFGPTTSWAGDRCTVLVPNSSLTTPNLARNTLHNCESAKNDAVVAGPAICMRPDSPLATC